MMEADSQPVKLSLTRLLVLHRQNMPARREQREIIITVPQPITNRRPLTEENILRQRASDWKTNGVNLTPVDLTVGGMDTVELN